MIPSSAAITLDPRLTQIAASIRAEIPGAEVRLFGSRARGQARSHSDADLLITVPDAWLEEHSRLKVLGELGRQHSSHQLPLDLLLYSRSEVKLRMDSSQSVTSVAYREGILLDDNR